MSRPEPTSVAVTESSCRSAPMWFTRAPNRSGEHPNRVRSEYAPARSRRSTSRLTPESAEQNSRGWEGAHQSAVFVAKTASTEHLPKRRASRSRASRMRTTAQRRRTGLNPRDRWGLNLRPRESLDPGTRFGDTSGREGEAEYSALVSVKVALESEDVVSFGIAGTRSSGPSRWQTARSNRRPGSATTSFGSRDAPRIRV